MYPTKNENDSWMAFGSETYLKIQSFSPKNHWHSIKKVQKE